MHHSCAALRGTLCLCIVLLAPSTAIAALTLTLVTTPNFGIIFSGASGRQFILNTNDTVTGANASDHISGAVAGQFTVADTTSPATVNILVDNISTLGGLDGQRSPLQLQRRRPAELRWGRHERDECELRDP